MEIPIIYYVYEIKLLGYSTHTHTHTQNQFVWCFTDCGFRFDHHIWLKFIGLEWFQNVRFCELETVVMNVNVSFMKW